MGAGERIRVISELDPGDGAFDVTDDRVMAALREAEDRHFWHRTRNEWIAERLRNVGVSKGARIIELGCGGGCVTAHLSRCGYEVVGVEGQRGLVELAASRASEARFWLHDLRRGVGELPERGFDVAGLFDVIEHIERPREVLESACTLVREGGMVVGTVPALRALWSRIDEQSGHKTRYEVETLREVLRGVSGAEVVEVVPFNRALVPLLWVQRKLVTRQDRSGSARANLEVPRAPVNELMAGVLRAERRLSRWLDTPRVQGSSLWFAIRVVPRGGVEPPT